MPDSGTGGNGIDSGSTSLFIGPLIRRKEWLLIALTLESPLRIDMNALLIFPLPMTQAGGGILVLTSPPLSRWREVEKEMGSSPARKVYFLVGGCEWNNLRRITTARLFFRYLLGRAGLKFWANECD